MIVYIGLGSNEGERELLISQAVQALHRHAGVHVTQLSCLREYDPVGGPPQQKFINAAAEIDTSLSPHGLLDALQAIERSFGRRPTTIRWGPRPMDLDLLLYGELVIADERLTLPHPRMHERKFVLEPLADIAPQARHPTLQQTIEALLETLCASSDPSAR